MIDKKDFVSRLNMAYVVGRHSVFDVFVLIAEKYPDLASALFDKYVEFIRNNNKSVQHIAKDQRQERAESMAKENIGYFIGNCNNFETRKFLFKTYPMAYHPVLGREF